MENTNKNAIGIIRERHCRWAKLAEAEFPLVLDFDEEVDGQLQDFSPRFGIYAILFRSSAFLTRALDTLNRTRVVKDILLFLREDDTDESYITWEYSSKVKCFAHTGISDAELLFLLSESRSFQSVFCIYSPNYFKKHILTPRDDENQLMVLTDREMEVLLLIAEGATNRTIADVLVISENTAKTHVRRILEKLQLTSRTKAALYARERGLVR